jgi:16S rRNA (guanine1207-N2)-methyltransferase
VTALAGVFGKPPAELANVDAGALQFSPLMPGASALEQQAEGVLAAFTMLAPPGTLERRYAMALALRAVTPGGSVTVLAAKDRGGTRLRKELEAFGCAVEETARRHHRIAVCTRPAAVTGIDDALATGGPRLVAETGLWSQPGVFSWDRLDPGSAMLLQHLPSLSGRGADLGCGLGILSRAALSSVKVTYITLIDIDRRAVEAAQRNVTDRRAHFIWADARDPNPDLTGLDFVVMNAPFHDAGTEDKALAQGFVKRVAEVLRKDGVCWLVANRHLPYETIMQPLFKRISLKIETGGYKIYEAHK